MKDTLSFFQTRFETFNKQTALLKRKSSQISLLRILTVVIGVILSVMAANNNQAQILWLIILISLILFLILIKWHHLNKNELELNSALKEVNRDETYRVLLDLKALDDGMEFHDPNHPFHEDLDIFGRHSLFQLINRTSTPEGKQVLASWMSYSSVEQGKNRQSAIEELKNNVEFRQLFEANGRINSLKDHVNKGFFNWLKESDQLTYGRLYLILLFILPALTLGSIITSILELTVMGLPLLIILINWLVLGSVSKRLLDITRTTENGYKSISTLKSQLLLIENESFNTNELLDLKSGILSKHSSASDKIGQLKFLLDSLHSRFNLMYWLLNSILLTDVFWLIKITNWKTKNELEIQRWFEVTAEFDALSSIAGFAFAEPNFVYPELVEEQFSIKALSLGHPLISQNKRVANDFRFEGKGGICLITGSNMSGKSTFLRTLGINVVLSQLGAPVCSKEFEIGPMQVFTSMRTRDELEENVSSFYAELKRLKQLLETINDEGPTLFMIDEVLKGTNSDDRHKGALALIKQLNKTNAFGLVSTHDLVLGGITNELSGVRNYSFNSRIENREILFDYQLTPGICKSFNATQLMKNMRIEIPN